MMALRVLGGLVLWMSLSLSVASSEVSPSLDGTERTGLSARLEDIVRALAETIGPRSYQDVTNLA